MFYSCSNFLCMSLPVSVPLLPWLCRYHTMSVSLLAWLCRYHKRRFDVARPLVIYDSIDLTNGRCTSLSVSLCLSLSVLRIATASITRNDTWILQFFVVRVVQQQKTMCRPRHRPLSPVSLAAAAAYKNSKPKRESTGIRHKLG
jgi:hypothetical protein